MKRIFTLLLMTPLVCNADWFGPKTYEDCILEGMKGTTSDVAAQEIRKACRSKFPLPPKPTANKQTISGQQANQTLNNAKLGRQPNLFNLGDHKIEFHNPLNLWVTQLTIAVEIDRQPPILFKSTSQARPLSKGDAYFDLGLSDKSKVTSWWVHEIETSDKDPRYY